MPKVKVLSRSEEDYVRERAGDKDQLQRNPNPVLHPQEKAIEYTRALNAVKLDKVFAKPFICALDGHRDGVYCIERHPTLTSALLSGCCDGELKVWNLRTKKAIATLPEAHSGFVRGITCVSNGEQFLSCGDDKTVKFWRMPTDLDVDRLETVTKPITTYMGDNSFTSIDHQKDTDVFATAGLHLDVWNHNRAEPIHSFQWSADTIGAVRFNKLETHIIGSVGGDRNICFYDLRSETPIHKVILKMRSNALSWNPMEAFNFSVANEDQNCYTFDMRKLDSALKVHTDHVAAVLDIDYSPTGKEFVTGSYDRTIRIFSIHSPHSREIYHTTRMHRVFGARFTADANFVVSASEDTNIRLWKANAAKPLGVLHPRQVRAIEYKEQLKNRYRHLPEIRRISSHRHVPRAIKVARFQKSEHINSQNRKEKNRVEKSKGKLVQKSVKEKPVIEHTS